MWNRISEVLCRLEVVHWVTIFTAVIAAIVVMAGWGISSYLTSGRDQRNAQQTQKIGFLIEAYNDLAISSNRAMTPEFARMLESAVAKIQLFGTPDEVIAVHQFLDNWSKPQPDGRPRASVDPLLFLLRNSLRSELRLPAIDSSVRWIRPAGGLQ
jgi:hypothetical protein